MHYQLDHTELPEFIILQFILSEYNLPPSPNNGCLIEGMQPVDATFLRFWELGVSLAVDTGLPSDPALGLRGT